MEGFAYPWSGAMFSPGPAPMAPVNLSSRKAIGFWAKGDGQTYQVMIFAQHLGYRPATRTFVAGPDWKQFTLTFASLATSMAATSWQSCGVPGPRRDRSRSSSITCG